MLSGKHRHAHLVSVEGHVRATLDQSLVVQFTAQFSDLLTPSSEVYRQHEYHNIAEYLIHAALSDCRHFG